MKFKPSKDPVDENAQQDPHVPWFFTAVTAPFYLQSTVEGNSLSFDYKNDTSTSCASTSGMLWIAKQPIYSLNSGLVRSENWFNPRVLVSVGSEFQAWMRR